MGDGTRINLSLLLNNPEMLRRAYRERKGEIVNECVEREPWYSKLIFGEIAINNDCNTAYDYILDYLESGPGETQMEARRKAGSCIREGNRLGLPEGVPGKLCLGPYHEKYGY